MMNEYRELWTLIEADLARARQTLPDSATCDEAVCRYHEFIGHNELELACDELEHYAKGHTAPKEFWIALRDAAIRMELFDRAKRYEQESSN
jgi:hypothetical protein